MDWQTLLSHRHFVHGGPVCAGFIRKEATDFVVVEELGFTAHGSGEHDWLVIRKTNANSQAVADQLARIAKVARSAVSFSGLKDNRAITTQTFTVWRPKGTPIDYAKELPASVEVIEQDKHNKKLRRGAHRSNRFSITVDDIPLSAESAVSARCEMIAQFGVPNYFGAQRFGRDAQNMIKACEMFRDGASGIARPLKSILLSAARSWLFNELVSQRIANNRFASAEVDEWLNLNGSASVFLATDDSQQRLAELDVHPTAALWGRGSQKWRDKAPAQLDWEQTVLAPYTLIREGLERFGLEYQRRPIRAKVEQLNWTFNASPTVGMLQCTLEFSLHRGQFATSVLRELFAGIE